MELNRQNTFRLPSWRTWFSRSHDHEFVSEPPVTLLVDPSQLVGPDAHVIMRRYGGEIHLSFMGQ
jgi:hypothetical protein